LEFSIEIKQFKLRRLCWCDWIVSGRN